MAKKRRKPRLVPAELYEDAKPIPVLIQPGPPRLLYVRREVAPFWVSDPIFQEVGGEWVNTQAGNNYWFVQLLNENTELQYASQYIVEEPAKSKLPRWDPQELAIACADRLSEYRGLVGLQEYRDGICVFSALFASNSMWTFCIRSTDLERCPMRKPWPDGWKSGEPLPENLPRKEGIDCHHPEPQGGLYGKDAKFCKVAQKAFA